MVEKELQPPKDLKVYEMRNIEHLNHLDSVSMAHFETQFYLHQPGHNILLLTYFEAFIASQKQPNCADHPLIGKKISQFICRYSYMFKANGLKALEVFLNPLKALDQTSVL